MTAPEFLHELDDDAPAEAVAVARPLRVLYAAGPGDVIGTFEHWKAGRDDPTSVALTYSGQFYNAVRALRAQAYVVAQRETGRVVRDRGFVLEDRGNHLQSATGIRYHLGQLWYGLRLWGTALRFGADAAVVSCGTHWFVLSLLALSGVRVIPTLHCALWPAGYRPRGLLRRTVQWLDGLFWRKLAYATVCVSPECERQVREIARDGQLRGPVYQVRAQYHPGALDTIPAAEHARPLRVMFAGRIERGKGVFDLLEVIDRLERSRPGDFAVEYCGSGAALEALRDDIGRRGLGHVANARGRLDAPDMRDAFARAHVVVVPTTREFAEGLNKVAVEAVLAGRPVITSRLANVAGVLDGAIIEVPPGDLDGYRAALERLADDPVAYADARAACGAAQSIFYDRSLGWEAAVRRILAPLRRDASTPDADAVTDTTADAATVAKRDRPLRGAHAAHRPGEADRSHPEWTNGSRIAEPSDAHRVRSPDAEISADALRPHASHVR